MSASWRTQATALGFRDVVRQIADERIRSQRPAPNRAQVVSIDRENRVCEVLFPADTEPVTVQMGALQPGAPGDWVRVNGLANARYVEDVIGEAYIAGGATILDGPYPPSGSLGDPGDYYADTTEGVLYGPKDDLLGGMILLEAFDDSANWTVGGAVGFDEDGRTGNAVFVSGATNYMDYSIASANQSAYLTIGFAYNPGVANVASRSICEFWSDGVLQNKLVLDATLGPNLGKVSFTRGTTTLATSSTGLVTVDAWQYIEVQVFLDDTAGFVFVEIDGLEVIADAPPGDTRNGGTTGLYDMIRIGPQASGLLSFYDDLYLKVGPGLSFEGDTEVDPWPITVRTIPGFEPEGGGEGANEVWVSAAAPVDPAIELWYDTDAISTVLEPWPIHVSATEPIAADYGELTIPLNAIWVKVP